MMSRELDPTSAAFSLVSTWDGWVWWASPPFFLFLSFLFSLFKFFIDFFLFISHHVPHLHSSPCLFVSALATCPQKRNKQKSKQTNNPSCPGDAVCHNILLKHLTNVHCNESWSGLGPLASATLTILNPHSDSSWIYVVLFHEDPAAAWDL